MVIFDWNTIEHKHDNKTTGQVKLKCPNCIDTRTNKADKSLYVHYGDGIAKCFYCEGLSFRDSVQKKTTENYKLPEQNWKNYTTLSDGMVKFLESRGIQQFTANELGFTEEPFYQPVKKSRCVNLVFNYFEGDAVVNKKYRTRDKHFTQSAGTKSIFYNINSTIGAEQVWITEGEFDVAALTQVGIKACVSVPNGANNDDKYWVNSEPYLRDVKKFMIATDNDTKGNELAEKIAHRLGKYRCERVIFDGKDANDDLLSGVLEDTAYRSKKYPVSGTFTINDVYDKVMELWRNGLPPVIYPKHRCFGNFRDTFSMMRGHLITGTGIPSHGKSNFTEWLVMNIVNDYGMKASFFSPEHQPMWLHQSAFIEKYHGKNFFKEYEGCPRIDEIDIAKYSEWANEKIYLTSPENGEFATWSWLFDKFREQLFNFGVDIFVIDAWNKVEFDAGDKRQEREKISSTLSKLASFAQQNDVIIILIAHPTKMQKLEDGLYKKPDLYDVSGSADFRNQTHDGFCVYRYFDRPDDAFYGYTTFTNLKTKYKFQGEMLKFIEYDYHIPSGRYYLKGSEVPTFCLGDLKLVDISKDNLDDDTDVSIPKINPSDAFSDSVEASSSNDEEWWNKNNDDDVPF